MFLSVSAELGGSERSLLDILASLRRAEPSWTLTLITAAEGPIRTEASALGVATEVLPFPQCLARIGEAGAPRQGRGVRLALQLGRAALPVARYVRHLRREIEAFGPDILHTHGLKMHVVGAWAARPPVAVVWHLHDYLRGRPATARLLRAMKSRSAAAVANSASVAEDARLVLGDGVPIVSVLNAVDLERFCTRGEQLDLDALAGLAPAAPGTIKVGLVAAFGRWKGHTTFLEAIARLPLDPPVRAYVVGGALYRTEGSQHTLDDLRQHAARLGVSDRVGFTGFVAHPEQAIRALDIVVHASTAPEPFGLVIAEAMACGRPIIASEAGGACEIFTSGVDGLGHVPGNPESLAARIAELARDADKRVQMGWAGRQTAERRFDRSRLAHDLAPVYRHAVVHG
jgi:glycosyltransferase involved in cell wall biosynthesis